MNAAMAVSPPIDAGEVDNRRCFESSVRSDMRDFRADYRTRSHHADMKSLGGSAGGTGGWVGKSVETSWRS